MASSIEIVAFDLGGVLVQVEKNLDDAFFEGELFSKLTLGALSSNEYLAKVANRLEQDTRKTKVLFSSMVEKAPYADQLIKSLLVPFTFWSNINVCHFEHLLQNDSTLARHQSETRGLSYELGFAKPDKVFFEQCLKRCHIAPSRILYLDDCCLNIDVARDLGIHTRHVTSLREIEAALSHFEAIPNLNGLASLA